MKRFIALLLVALLVMSMSAALAVDTSTFKSDATQFEGVVKTYTTTKGVFPDEVLEFESEADKGNPDGGAANLTVKPLQVTANSLTTAGDKLTIEVPSFSKAGVYTFTITEKPGDSQGVTYSTEKISISILVSYNYTDNKLDTEIGVTKINGEKNEGFENIYDIGGDKDGKESLVVSKTVTGNLGDRDKLFTITVKFTAENYVRSDITITGGSGTNNPTSIPHGNGWKENSVEIYLKDGATVEFEDIPAGVKYEVVEDPTHLIAGNEPTMAELNGVEGYKATYTPVEGEVKTDAQTGKQYVAGTVAKDGKPSTAITNDKTGTINTGIILQYAPYIAILAIVLAGAILMIVRRRRSNED